MRAHKKFKILFSFMSLLFVWHCITIMNSIAKNNTKHQATTDSSDNTNKAINSISLRNTPYPGADDYTRYAVARLGLSQLRNVEPLKPELGPVVNDVTSFRYPINIPSCPGLNSRRNIFIAVISAIGNFEQRAIIRETWAKDLNNVWNRTVECFTGFAFILGGTQDKSIQGKIEEDNASHKDIIQIAITDAYRNLPIKMAGLLNWMHKNCANFKGFLFKVDDDVYLNLHALKNFVNNYNPFIPNIFGTKYFMPYPPIRGNYNNFFSFYRMNLLINIISLKYLKNITILF